MTEKSRITVGAICLDCDFKRIVNYNNTLRDSRKHVKENKTHTVRITRKIIKDILYS